MKKKLLIGFASLVVLGIIIYIVIPKFEVSNLTLNLEEGEPGETVTVTVEVQNVGKIKGTHELELEIDGIVEQSEAVTLGGGEITSVSFSVEKDIEGFYSVELGRLTGVFEVVGPKPTTVEATVIRVIDGDTIEVNLEGTIYRVRYIGIDTPETVHPSQPVECFGKEASDKNAELVEEKMVRLEKDVSETDKYGRLLRYVWVGDILVNDYLVRQGYAYASTYPPDVKYSEQFAQAQREAEGNNRGLWAACQ